MASRWATLHYTRIWRGRTRSAVSKIVLAAAVTSIVIMAAAGTSSASGPASSIFGPVPTFSALNTTWTSLLSTVRSGHSSSIAFYGDSITAGYLSSTPGKTDFVTDFRNLISNAVPSTPGWEFASATYDTDTHVTGQWSIALGTGFGFMGEGVGSALPNATGSYSYGPVEASTFDVMLDVSPQTGPFGYQIDGGTVHSIGDAGQDGTTVVNVPAGSLGLHTITFTTNHSGLTGPALVVGVEPIVDTGSLMVTRGGIGGMTSGALGAGFPGWAGYDVAETEAAPTVSVFMFGSNDWYKGVPVATTTANLTAMVMAARSAGSTPILLVPPAPEYSTVSGSIAPFSTYEGAIVSVGAQLNVPVLNLAAQLGPWNSSFMADPYHPNDVGYQEIASAIYSAVTTPSTGNFGGFGPLPF